MKKYQKVLLLSSFLFVVAPIVSSCSIVLPDSIALKSTVSFITDEINSLTTKYIDQRTRFTHLHNKNSQINLKQNQKEAVFYSNVLADKTYEKQLRKQIAEAVLEKNHLANYILTKGNDHFFSYDKEIISIINLNLLILFADYIFQLKNDKNNISKQVNVDQFLTKNYSSYFLVNKPVAKLIKIDDLNGDHSIRIIFKDQSHTDIGLTKEGMQQMIKYKKLSNFITTRSNITLELEKKNSSRSVNYDLYEHLLTNKEWKALHDNLVEMLLLKKKNEEIKIDIRFLNGILLNDTLTSPPPIDTENDWYQLINKK
ncbi:hypothetical protein JM47_02080 [Ureaplasma diversum]|uniref:Lipoprotein n=1 Tax=Ureaplasma diversum TaxID=42094 RepID=A0A0C5RL61_9BACT|nr:hypothetical protein [Ureaplasma diversum]AJQ45373.1 hypothetical protein JM47_02080 [Ureaplasma diversum]